MSKSIFTNSKTKEKTTFNKLHVINDELLQIQKLLNTHLASYIEMTIQEYYSGHFERLLELLPKVKLESLLAELYSYKKNSIQYPTYEKVRTLLKLYLEGLIKAINQYLDILNIKNKLEKSQQRAGILDDMDKLQDYINKIQTSMRIFNPPPQTVVPATIKQEHATYLRMYGYPEGGIFDVEKLNNIIVTQKAEAAIAAKTITM